MDQIAGDPQRYDAMTILLHWLTAIMVVALWIGAKTLSWLPRGPLQADARSLHVVLGLALAILIAGRLVWRLSWGRPLPRVSAGAYAAAAEATHRGLYAMLAAMIFVGVLLVSTTGDSFFGQFNLTQPAPADRALADQLRGAHSAFGWVILAIAGLHSLAALYHHFVLRDALLERMLPRRREKLE